MLLVAGDDDVGVHLEEPPDVPPLLLRHHEHGGLVVRLRVKAQRVEQATVLAE